MFELPVHDGGRPRERADAARNRARILAAAGRLVEDRGIANVSMDDVARAAHVGAGTLYRRFGDRAGLALALLDQHTRDFQDALLSGPPPLGPGAPAADRLRAFGDGYLEVLERHADLICVAISAERDGTGPGSAYATHLTILLRQAAPHLDAPFVALALLAALAPGEYLHARHDLDWPIERMRRGWDCLITALTASPADER